MHAIDWLYDQGIVFDVLPNDDTVREIAEKNIRTQVLACLTYLEHEPDQEFMGIWQIMFGLVGGGLGFLVAQLLDSDDTQETGENGAQDPDEEDNAQDPDEDNVQTAPEADDTAAVDSFDLSLEVSLITAFGGLALILALGILLLAFKINRNSKHVAAWANSWSTAIRDYDQRAKPDPEPNGNQPDPDTNPNQQAPATKSTLIAKITQFLCPSRSK